MHFLLHVKLTRPEGMTNKEFYGAWVKEAEALGLTLPPHNVLRANKVVR